MRTMLRIAIDVEAGSRAVQQNVISKLVQQTTDLIKPEAAYFTGDHGTRTIYYFFDMKDSSIMPVISEPWFSTTNAKIEFQPVMNGEELRAGLEKALKK